MSTDNVRINLDRSHRDPDHSGMDIILPNLGIVASSVKDPLLYDLSSWALEIHKIVHVKTDRLLLALTLKIIEGLRETKNAFQSLARNVCALVYGILHSPGFLTQDPGFLDHLQELRGTLLEIRKFADEQAARGVVSQIAQEKTDLVTIKRFEDRLEQSRTTFGPLSSGSANEYYSMELRNNDRRK